MHRTLLGVGWEGLESTPQSSLVGVSRGTQQHPLLGGSTPLLRLWAQLPLSQELGVSARATYPRVREVKV